MSRAVPRPASAAPPTLLFTPAPTTPTANNLTTATTTDSQNMLMDDDSGQQNQTSQTPAATGGSLFGNLNASQPQQSTSLFGNTAGNTQSNTGTGLFGASTNQNNQQQTGTSSLFGNSTANRPAGGLFGASTTNNASSGGGLFGSGTGNSLFGGNNAQPNQQQSGTGLFGASTQQNQQQNTGLFGASQQKPNSGLFGASTQQQPFGGMNSQAQAPSNSFLGLTATAPGANQRFSLLGASQFRHQQQPGQFVNRLQLGQQNATQPNAGQQQGASAIGAVQVNFDNMRSTTRFNDLIPDVQQALERIDNMIRKQEDFCRQIETFIPGHGKDVESVKPDIEFVSEKTEAVETALGLDANGVQAEKKILEKDVQTGERLQRVVSNLNHPVQYHVRGDDTASSDLDLISHFFRPLTEEMSSTLSVYAIAISEVEGHLGLLETSAQDAGMRLGSSSREGLGSVRELAETLGAFEEGILGAAAMVGQCREGVTSLVLGR